MGGPALASAEMGQDAMGHDDAFLRDICENPDDDAPRMIYADWLSDHGQPERAEFIRLQCRLAAADALDDPDRWMLLARAEQLLRAHGKGWVGPLRRLVKRWRFRRGFVEWAALPAATFLGHGEELFRLAPVRHVRLLGEAVPVARRHPWTGQPIPPGRTQSLERLLPDLLEAPHLAKLRGLDLSYQLFDLLVFDVLIESAHFPRLESLNLSGTAVCSDEGFHLLAGAGQLEHLRELSLSDPQNERQAQSGRSIGGEAMAALAHSPHLRRVDRLALGCGAADLTPEAVAALARSPLLGQLTELSINPQFTALGWDEPQLEAILFSERVARLQVLRLRQARWLALESIFASPHLASLRCLDLSNGVPWPGSWASFLAGAHHQSALRELSLCGCRVGDEGLRALAGARSLPQLTALNLDRNFFSAEALRDFARSVPMANLRWLSVQGPRAPVERASGEPERRCHREFRIGDAAAAAFAFTPQAAGLVYLDLGNQRIADAGAAVLAKSPYLAGLRTLRLWNNEIGAAGARALLDAAALPHLTALDLRSNPLPELARLALRQRFGAGVRYGRGPVPQSRIVFED